MAWTAPRTWATSEVVTAAIMNTHVRDNFNHGRGRSVATRTAGNLSLNSTAWATASTTLDLTLAAAANDRIAAHLSAAGSTGSVDLGLDAIATNSGTHFSGVSGNNAFGCMSWYIHGTTAAAEPTAGGINVRTLSTGDVSGGNVIVRLRYKTGSASARTVNASTTKPLRFEAWNFGVAV